MEIVKKNLSELIPLEKNVRKHSDTQIEEFIRSINQFGQTRAFVLDEQGNVLVGNGMYYAMKKMGATEVDCYVMPNLTEAQKKKLILSDNRIYSLGMDNYSMIEEFVNDVVKTGDLDIAGFDELSLQVLVLEDRSEDVKEDAMAYGVTDKSTKQEDEIPAPRPTPNPTPAYTPPVEPEKQAVQVENPAPASGQTRVEPERKKVICPSCGEVIYLD